MVKTYLKTLGRMFKKHITRLISILFIVLVSVGFVSGIGMAVDKIKVSLNDYYAARNVSDFIVKSTANGFLCDEEDPDSPVARLKTRYGQNNVNVGFSADVFLQVNGEKQLVRLYFFDGETTVNVRQEIRSTISETPFAAGAEEQDNYIKGLPLGSTVTLDFKGILLQLSEQSASQPNNEISAMPSMPCAVTVTKTERSPLTFGMDKEPSYLNGDIEIPDNIDAVNKLIGLDNILYLSYDVIPAQLQSYFPPNDLYIALSDRKLFDSFSDRYIRTIANESAEITKILGDDIKIVPLEKNYSFSALHSYAEKVANICWVLLAAFLLVTALVVLSTMTRLLEEERAQIACLRTLGYPAWRIILKYVLFAAIGLGIGGVGGYFVGIGIARLLYIVFHYSFAMPPMTPHVTLLFFIIIFSVIVAVTLAATALSGIRLTNEKPSELLRPKAPKSGKKVLLERIPFFWNLLPFKYKSTTRNVLRFKSRFLMTVVAVAFSTSLVMAGLALLDLCLFQGLNSPSITAISLVVVFFAGLLTAAVIYTLTNINISERNRELATLMVLGYFDREVSGYIYREVFLDTVIGLCVGLPCSLAILKIVYDIMAVGSIASMSWFMWLIAPSVVLLFTALVTLLLRRKIVKVDMNESLKAIE